MSLWLSEITGFSPLNDAIKKIGIYHNDKRSSETTVKKSHASFYASTLHRLGTYAKIKIRSRDYQSTRPTSLEQRDRRLLSWQGTN